VKNDLRPNGRWSMSVSVIALRELGTEGRRVALPFPRQPTIWVLEKRDGVAGGLRSRIRGGEERYVDCVRVEKG
jgi:hypothetical protein